MHAPDRRAEHLHRPRAAPAACGVLLDEKRAQRQAREYFELLHLTWTRARRSATSPWPSSRWWRSPRRCPSTREVLIMDEPTASLTSAEIEELFRIIRELQGPGRGRRLHLAPAGGAEADLRPHHRHARRQLRGHRAPPPRPSIDDDHQHDGRPHPLRDVAQSQGHRQGEVVAGGAQPAARPCHQGRELQGRAGARSWALPGSWAPGRTEVARAIFGADPMEAGEIVVSRASACTYASPATLWRTASATCPRTASGSAWPWAWTWKPISSWPA